MINILKESFGWKQIFEQEGILFNLLSTIPDKAIEPIIINRNLSNLEVSKIKSLVNSGLAVLTDFPNLQKILHLKVKTQQYETEYGKGYIIALPFDVNQAICDTRSERKPFYYPSRKFPNEIVSKVSKGEIRRLVINCIRKLFAKMNLPYVHLWYYPNEYKSAFAFRVDTDFGPEDTLKATFNLEDKTNVKFTYFINTKEHSKLANNKRDFQLHCYLHEVYKDYQRNYDNIQKAKGILEQSGIKPIGFVSPFGFWNQNLQKAMEDLNIEYSSEFSLDYDDLPFYPIIENRRSKVLQIPVHPICIGRLVYTSLTQEQCIDYYQRYFEQQLQINEPIFIYDHPHRIAQFPDVFYKILTNAKNLPSVWLTNMTEFYHWWKVRVHALNNTQWKFENRLLSIKTTDQDNKIHLHIITPDNKQTFVPLQQTLYNLQDLSYKSILMAKPIDAKEYRRLKSKSAKVQMKFYATIDKILEIMKKE